MYISTHRMVDTTGISSWAVSQEHATIGSVALRLSLTEIIYLTLSEAREMRDSLTETIDLAEQETPL